MDNGAHIVVQLIDKQLLSLKQEFFPPDSQIKGLSTEYLPEGANKKDYNHSPSAVASEITKGKLLKGTISSKLKILPTEYEKKINLLFADEVGITTMGLKDDKKKAANAEDENEKND